MATVFTLFIGIFSSLHVMAEDVVTWNFSNKLRYKGSACPYTKSLELIPAGSKMSLIFSEAGAELQTETDPLQIKRSCVIKVPVEIAPLHRAKKLRQHVIYGYERETHTNGRLVFGTQWGRLGRKRVETKIPTRGFDPFSAPFVELPSDYKIKSQACSKKPTRLFLKIDLALHAQRRNKEKAIILQTDGFDVCIDSYLDVEPCQVRR